MHRHCGEGSSDKHYISDAELDPNRPSRKFSAPRPLEDPLDVEAKEKQRLRQERLLTVNEEALDEVDLEKKRAQKADEDKRREERWVLTTYTSS